VIVDSLCRPFSYAAMSRRARWFAVQPTGQPGVKRPLVQILVVVATIQM